MSERRGKRQTKDPGARTRRTDHAESPDAFAVWTTTFHLRWAEHVKRGLQNGATAAA